VSCVQMTCNSGVHLRSAKQLGSELMALIAHGVRMHACVVHVHQVTKLVALSFAGVQIGSLATMQAASSGVATCDPSATSRDPRRVVSQDQRASASAGEIHARIQLAALMGDARMHAHPPMLRLV
jgi:hypothetical protein